LSPFRLPTHFSKTFHRHFAPTATPVKKTRTYYTVLGVKQTATHEEIRKAYLKKAKELHPDRNQDDPEAQQKFQEVQEAYNIVSDHVRRGMYDRNLVFNDPVYAQKGGLTEETDWRERWRNETDEEREKRRERYRRYAKGERADIPPLAKWYGIGWVCWIVFCYAGAWILCIYLPKLCGYEDLEHFTDFDSADSQRGVPLVRAFHNPLSNRWEIIPEGFDAPTPYALVTYWRKQNPGEFVDFNSVPKQGLTVLKVPRTEASKASLLRDSESGDTIFPQQRKPNWSYQ